MCESVKFKLGCTVSLKIFLQFFTWLPVTEMCDAAKWWPSDKIKKNLETYFAAIIKLLSTYLDYTYLKHHAYKTSRIRNLLRNP